MPTIAGISTLLGLIAIATTVALGMGRLGAHVTAQAAADLTAISAATALLSGESAVCEVAADIAQANNADLTSCQEDTPEPDTVTVAVQVKSRTAQATAGPVG